MDKRGRDSSQGMCPMPKIVLNKLALYILLIIFTTGCCPVQDIVPSEVDPASWYLSPSGDKLLYSPRAHPEHLTVRFLATSQEVIIGDCPRFGFVWLDDETVYCYEMQGANHSGEEPYDIPVAAISHISASTDTFPKIPIQTVTADQVELDALVKHATAVYRLQPSFSGLSNSLLILDIKSQENTKQYYHLTGIENLDEVLKSYDYPPIPLYMTMGDTSSNKVYSPNQAFYFVLGGSLRIYDATNNNLVAEFKPPADWVSYFQLGGSYPNKSGGWAADSSGVYFQIQHSTGFLGRPTIRPIQKLCVPWYML